jgi:hypothetical protein
VLNFVTQEDKNDLCIMKSLIKDTNMNLLFLLLNRVHEVTLQGHKSKDKSHEKCCLVPVLQPIYIFKVNLLI